MNKIKRPLSIAVILLTVSFTVQAQDCTIVSDGGSFFYGVNNAITVEIDGTSYTETHANGVINSTIAWTGDCAYTITIDEVTIPDFPHAIGTQMSVVITSIDGIKIFYTSTINGDSWDSVMGKSE